MAQRRMFSLKIVDTDAFCEMPVSAQNLYFHIGMRADDEGFYAGVKGLMVKIHASNDDLQALLGHRYLLDRGDGVYVVKHWKVNNYLQTDRIQETEYAEKKIGLYTKKDGSYTLDPSKDKSLDKKPCIQNVYIGKCSKGLDKCSEDTKEGAGDASQIVMDDESDDTAKDFKEMFKGGLNHDQKRNI